MRHLLAAPGGGPVEAARAVVALHASDPATVHLSAAARSREPDVAAVERALYEDRALIRMLGMRRTMFVVPDELAPVVQAACTDAIAARERTRLVKRLQDAGIADDAGAWLAEVEEATLARAPGARRGDRRPAVRGRAAPAHLGADGRGQAVRGAPERLHLGAGAARRWTGASSAVARAARGSRSQYRWSPIERWLPDGMPAWDREEAGAELVRR